MMADYITTIYPPISHRSPDDEKHYWSHGLNQAGPKLEPAEI